MKDTFIIRTEWFDAIMELKPLEQAEIFQNLYYFHSDKKDKINLNNLSVKLVWKLIEPNLIRNIDNWDKRSVTSKENGSLGGRPLKNKHLEEQNNLTHNLNKPKKPNETLNVSVSVSDSVPVSVSESVCVSEKTHPPAREKFLSFCKSLNIDFDRLKETIEAKYDTWVKAGWKDGNGKPIDDYEQKIINTLPYLKPMPTKSTPTTVKANFGSKKGGSNG